MSDTSMKLYENLYFEWSYPATCEFFKTPWLHGINIRLYIMCKFFFHKILERCKKTEKYIDCLISETLLLCVYELIHRKINCQETITETIYAGCFFYNSFFFPILAY